MNTLNSAAVDHLAMFAKAIKDKLISKFVIKDGIPLILFPRNNTIECDYLILCVGASWSDRDFRGSNFRGLHYFAWAEGIVEKFVETMVEPVKKVQQQSLAAKWLEGCSSYFDREKPCWRWFCRLIPFLDKLLQVAVEKKISVNWMFNDFILFPIVALGDIANEEVKRRMEEISAPVWEKYLASLRANKSIVLVVSGATVSDTQSNEDYILSKIPLVSIVENLEKKIVYVRTTEKPDKKTTKKPTKEQSESDMEMGRKKTQEKDR